MSKCARDSQDGEEGERRAGDGGEHEVRDAAARDGLIVIVMSASRVVRRPEAEGLEKGVRGRSQCHRSGAP